MVDNEIQAIFQNNNFSSFERKRAKLQVLMKLHVFFDGVPTVVKSLGLESLISEYRWEPRGSPEHTKALLSRKEVLHPWPV